MEAKKITDLRVGVRDENRVNVFLDGKFAFSLTIEQVADFKLKFTKSCVNGNVVMYAEHCFY